MAQSNIPHRFVKRIRPFTLQRYEIILTISPKKGAKRLAAAPFLRPSVPLVLAAVSAPRAGVLTLGRFSPRRRTAERASALAGENGSSRFCGWSHIDRPP
ncbi:hypothetical protein HMPREF1249_0963 [Jonquetella sp. BV3C21]|nr:hypothetical protein HMPREF1249_0963 [Jonquetella sp. BV3C21]